MIQRIRKISPCKLANNIFAKGLGILGVGPGSDESVYVDEVALKIEKH